MISILIKKYSDFTLIISSLLIHDMSPILLYCVYCPYTLLVGRSSLEILHPLPSILLKYVPFGIPRVWHKKRLSYGLKSSKFMCYSEILLIKPIIISYFYIRAYPKILAPPEK